MIEQYGRSESDAYFLPVYMRLLRMLRGRDAKTSKGGFNYDSPKENAWKCIFVIGLPPGGKPLNIYLHRCDTRIQRQHPSVFF